MPYLGAALRLGTVTLVTFPAIWRCGRQPGAASAVLPIFVQQAWIETFNWWLLENMGPQVSEQPARRKT